MSEEIAAGFDLKGAVSFNAHHAAGHLPLPQQAVRVFPQLAKSAASEEFALGVLAYQETHGFRPYQQDGKLGRGTRTHMGKEYQPVTGGAQFVVHNGLRLVRPSYPYMEPGSVWVNFEDEAGKDIHRLGLHSRRAGGPKDVRFLVIHWGGINPDHLYRYMKTVANTATGDDDISTHFGVGPGIAYQYLDTAHKAWHAGWANNHSIGIDVCQHCLQLDSTKHYGDAVGVIDSPTPRYRKQVLSLDPRTAIAARELVCDLLHLHGLPLRLAERDRVYTKAEVREGAITVFGHHNLSKNKVDVAPWWDTIFGELF